MVQYLRVLETHNKSSYFVQFEILDHNICVCFWGFLLRISKFQSFLNFMTSVIMMWSLANDLSVSKFNSIWVLNPSIIQSNKITCPAVYWVKFRHGSKLKNLHDCFSVYWSFGEFCVILKILPRWGLYSCFR